MRTSLMSKIIASVAVIVLFGVIAQSSSASELAALAERKHTVVADDAEQPAQAQKKAKKTKELVCGDCKVAGNQVQENLGQREENVDEALYARGQQQPLQQQELGDGGVDEEVRSTLRQHFPDEQQVMANDGQVDTDLRGNDDENLQTLATVATEMAEVPLARVQQHIEQVQARLVPLMNNPVRLREYIQRYQPVLDHLENSLRQQIEQTRARIAENRMGARNNLR